VLFPVRVQGRGAELEIAQAIEKLGRPEDFGYPRCDVIIVGRGGGSIEDLWNFNEESVARAIAACPIPIISAVGHEIDFTIADFVADLRAPTPSAAAELAVADGAELSARLAQWRRRLERLMRERLTRARLAAEALKRGVLQRDGEKLLREPMMRLDGVRARLAQAVRAGMDAAVLGWNEARAGHRAQHPMRVLERRLEALKHLRRRLDRAGHDLFERRGERLVRLRGLLCALGPESAFQRGFSITLGPDGKVLRSADGIRPGEVLRTRWSDGEICSRVLES
jgi:exodeoxyribonuclease VII large subunit